MSHISQKNLGKVAEDVTRSLFVSNNLKGKNPIWCQMINGQVEENKIRTDMARVLHASDYVQHF